MPPVALSRSYPPPQRSLQRAKTPARPARVPRTQVLPRALALPALPPVNPQAIAHGAVGVGLAMSAAVIGATKFRNGAPLRLRDLDAAAGSAAVMGTLLAVHHALIAQGVPGWPLPAAVMGTFSVTWFRSALDKIDCARVTTLGAWFMVACFEGLLNLRVPMAAALPLVVTLPACMLSAVIPEAIEKRGQEGSCQ